MLIVTAQAAEPQREESHVAGELLRCVAVEPGVNVEPAIHIALIIRQREIVDVTVENDIAETDGRSRLTLDNVGHLPAADEGIGPPRQTVREFAPFAERQFNDPARRDAMRAVARADRFVGQRVRRVQKLHGIHLLRPGVSQLEGESPGETFLDLRLQRVIPRITDRFLDIDRAERRVRPQQLFARCILPEDRIEAIESTLSLCFS